jgi:ankyrin repeat protein
LIKAYPKGVEISSTDGNTSLHFAVQYGQSKSIIEILLDAYPLALIQQNNDGETPLEIAKKQKQQQSSLFSSSLKERRKILRLMEEINELTLSKPNVLNDGCMVFMNPPSEVDVVHGFLKRISSRKGDFV